MQVKKPNSKLTKRTNATRSERSSSSMSTARRSATSKGSTPFRDNMKYTQTTKKPLAKKVATPTEVKPIIITELSVKQRQYLKGLAHNLDPVVMIGSSGLNDAVIKEIIVGLNAHELIKVRVLGDDRDLRASFIPEICTRAECHLVQHIGKLIILYRPSEKHKITLPNK
jgi:RNA-binding protein